VKTNLIFTLLFFVFLFGCSKDTETPEDQTKNLTIFFVNDVHGQIDNFSKVKHLIDAERQKTNVIVACSGDLFSGNPVVDTYKEKGFPIIDIMNQIGFDIAVPGNHEFDYGIETLAARIEQSDFFWVCANVDAGNSELPNIPAYTTINVNDLKVTFLGLVETGGSKQSVIPSTHPDKIKDLTFQHARDIVKNYMNIKSEEDADLFIALSHLGYNSYSSKTGDFQLAEENFFFDLIIGGHNHAIIDTAISNTPIFQAGKYLDYLGKIELTVKNKSVQSTKFHLINLSQYNKFNNELKALTDSYNDRPDLNEVIGSSIHYHSQTETGCFYTDALRQFMNVDVSFHNTGGFRTVLEQGDITRRDIYEIEPFNNGMVVYEMTVEEIKQFLIGSGSGFYYSGIIIQKIDDNIVIQDVLRSEIPNDKILKVGINDYIPAVHSLYFPDNGIVQTLKATETVIAYLEGLNETIDYSGSESYFRY
jgi:2',3'-cyclic-nucleotide 2'-phosphodiesterase (5'-nucleotidase family)